MIIQSSRKGTLKCAVLLVSGALLLSACKTLNEFRVVTAADYETQPVAQIQQNINVEDYSDYRVVTGPRIFLAEMQEARFRKLVSYTSDEVRYQLKLKLNYVEPQRNYNRVRDTMGTRFEMDHKVANGGCYSDTVCTATEHLIIDLPNSYVEERKFDGIFISAISDNREWVKDVNVPASYIQAVMQYVPAAGGAS